MEQRSDERSQENGGHPNQALTPQIRNRNALAAELVVLFVLLGAAGCIPVMPTALLLSLRELGRFLVRETIADSIWQLIFVASCFSGFGSICLFLVLLASRIRMRTSIFLATALLCFAVPLFIVYNWRTSEFFAEVLRRDRSLPNELKPDLLVSWSLMLLRYPLTLIVPLAAALYLVRNSFSWIKYLTGWLTGLALIYAACYYSWPLEMSGVLVAGICLNVLLGAALVFLPMQRAAAERLSGISLHYEPVPAFAGQGRDTSVAMHLVVVILAVTVAVFALIGHVEYRMLQSMIEGPRKAFMVPGAVNAYDVLKPHFTAGAYEFVEPPSAKMARAPKPPKHWSALLEDQLSSAGIHVLGATDVMTPEQLREALTLADRKSISSYLKSAEPYMRELEQAAQADYLQIYEPGQFTTPHYGAVRQTVRAMALRSYLNLLDNHPQEALRDVETLLRLSWLFDSDVHASLLQDLVAAVMIRGTALTIAQNCLLYFHDSPRDMNELRLMLIRNRQYSRVRFPAENLRRNGPGIWPVVLYAEFSYPAMWVAYPRYMTRWEHYDVLLLATAVECCEKDKGKLPGSLGELVPAYIDRVPVDPLYAKPYLYEVEHGKYRIQSSYPMELDQDKKPARTRPEMPMSKAQKEKAVKLLQELRSGNYGASKP